MIRRIELRNFMSHEHTVIEPAEGLTAIVGLNNIGKSAIVSAIQILCHNDKSTYVTRHGEKECSIKIETDDDHVVEWRRKNSSVRYTIDGEEYDRLGRSVPDAIFDALRLPRIENEGSDSFDVHVGEQKSPIFLLNQPSSRAAQFFASSSDASKLVEMQARHRDKVRDARRKKTELEGEAERLDESLEILAPIKEINKRVQKIEGDYQELSDLNDEIAALATDRHQLLGLVHLHKRHSAECDATAALLSPPKLSDTTEVESLIHRITVLTSKRDVASDKVEATQHLKEPPEMYPVEELSRRIGRIECISRVLERVKAEEQSLKSIDDPPELENTEELRIQITNFFALGKRIEAGESLVETLGGLSEPPKISDVTELIREIAAIERVSQKVCSCDEIHDTLDSLQELPTLIDFDPLADVVSQMNETDKKVRQHKKTVGEINKSLAEIRDELRDWAVDHQTCPTCGGEVDADLLLKNIESGVGGHAHG